MRIDTTIQPTVRTHSLSFHVTIWLGIATAIGMSVFAIYQYATMPGHTVLDLLLHHSWHVLALAAAIYVVSRVAFHKSIVQPLTKIYLHLYAMGAGQRTSLALKTNVTEIRTIVEGINLMRRRLGAGANANAMVHSRHEIAKLKEIIESMEVSELDTKSLALEQIAAFEKSLPVVVHNVNAPMKATLEDSPCCSQSAEA